MVARASTDAYKKRKRDWAKTDSQKEYRRNYMAKWRTANRDKANAQARKSHHKNKHKHVEKARERHLVKTYGLSLADYDTMLQEQNGVCYLCGQAEEGGRKLAVDHDHVTGTVRRLLCFRCNSHLGWYENHKDRVTKYLDIVW